MKGVIWTLRHRTLLVYETDTFRFSKILSTQESVPVSDKPSPCGGLNVWKTRGKPLEFDQFLMCPLFRNEMHMLPPIIPINASHCPDQSQYLPGYRSIHPIVNIRTYTSHQT